VLSVPSRNTKIKEGNATWICVKKNSKHTYNKGIWINSNSRHCVLFKYKSLKDFIVVLHDKKKSHPASLEAVIIGVVSESPSKGQ